MSSSSSVRLGKTKEIQRMKREYLQFCGPSSNLRCIVQESLELLKSISAVLPSSAELLSNNFSILSLSVTLTPLHPLKHVSCLGCYGFASTNGRTPTAVQAFQPFNPCPNLNQLKRDVKGKRNIGCISWLVKHQWPGDSAENLLASNPSLWQNTYIGIPRDKASRILLYPQ